MNCCAVPSNDVMALKLETQSSILVHIIYAELQSQCDPTHPSRFPRKVGGQLAMRHARGCLPFRILAIISLIRYIQCQISIHTSYCRHFLWLHSWPRQRLQHRILTRGSGLCFARSAGRVSAGRVRRCSMYRHYIAPVGLARK